MKRHPVAGDEVTIVYLNAREAAVVEAVDDDGRAVVVVTEHAEVLRLRLTATGSFVTADRTARLLWD